MSWYFFFQETGGDESWKRALADYREEVEAKAPAFVSVLDTDHPFNPPPEDRFAVHYRGPFYLDLDAASIEDAIVDAKSTVEAMEKLDVDLDTIEIFLSGGKGFHFVVPMAVFVDKMPRSGGFTKLPLIYRDIAMEHFKCNTLDMRVYSTGRGRMWRTPNVKRSNGLHKVRVTPQEVMSLTPETYRSIASSPRYLPPPAKPSAPALAFSSAFAAATDVVAARYKEGQKAKVDNEQVRRRYDGKFPEAMSGLLAGEVQSVRGFQETALQIAITAVALGKTVGQMIEESEGFLKNHSGDSDRYNTYGKRRIALQQAYYSADDNPTYTFSMAAIRAVLPRGTQDSEQGEGEQPALTRSISQGISFSPAGIFHVKDDAIVDLSKMGFGRPRMMLDLRNDGRVLGYQVDVYHHGERKGEEFLDVGSLQTRQRFQSFASAYSAAVHCTDSQVVALMELLKQKSEQEGSIVYATDREGLDLIKPEGATSAEDFDIAWVSKNITKSKKGRSYFLKSEDQEFGMFRSDLLSAGGLLGTPEEGDVIDALLKINTPYVVGAMLGWFSAAHARMIFDHFYAQFPLLQVFGQAGAGKSKTVDLMLRMHFWHADPQITASADVTPHSLQATCSASASLPAVFDEYKIREIQKPKVDLLRRMFKNAYTRASIKKGFIDHDHGTSRVGVRVMKFNAPVVFIGEAIESQTAILERSVVVNLTKDGRLGRKHHFDKVFDYENRQVLSRIGCAIVEAILDGDWMKLRKVADANRARIDEAWGEVANEGDDRQRFNAAAVLTGLDYCKAVVHAAHGERFDAEFNDLKEAVMHDSSSRTLSVVRKVQSELAKVMAALAYLSNEPPREDMRVNHSKDYTLEGDCIDIKAQTCFDKYRTYCKHVGQEALYDSFEAFITAIETYDGTVKGAGGDNMTLRDGPRTKVFRLKLDKLANEDVDSFKGQ